MKKFVVITYFPNDEVEVKHFNTETEAEEYVELWESRYPEWDFEFCTVM